VGLPGAERLKNVKTIRLSALGFLMVGLMACYPKFSSPPEDMGEYVDTARLIGKWELADVEYDPSVYSYGENGELGDPLPIDLNEQFVIDISQGDADTDIIVKTGTILPFDVQLVTIANATVAFTGKANTWVVFTIEVENDGDRITISTLNLAKIAQDGHDGMIDASVVENSNDSYSAAFRPDTELVVYENGQELWAYLEGNPDALNPGVSLIFDRTRGGATLLGAWAIKPWFGPTAAILLGIALLTVFKVKTRVAGRHSGIDSDSQGGPLN
jgi:hypothetical protein